jgi:RNA polymerase sigma-70 factor (ECF subfamily)
LSHPSDATLAEQVAQGDQQAFVSLYDRYSSRVYGLALRMMGERMVAEEVTQDVFVKLWSRAHRYQPAQGAFVAWLLTITRNTALDRLRGERRRPLLSDDLEPEDMWDMQTDGRSPADEADWHSLYFAVQSLPTEQRQVIELAFLLWPQP